MCVLQIVVAVFVLVTFYVDACTFSGESLKASKEIMINLYSIDDSSITNKFARLSKQYCIIFPVSHLET